MRKHPELRTMEHEGMKTGSQKKETPATGVTRPAEALERNLMNRMNEMERWVEESFHRPFFGHSWWPLRNIFHEAGSFGDIVPAVDVFEEKGEVVVMAELPGMRREDISLRIDDNNLIISGEKKSEERVEQKDYLRLERSHGTFTRTIALPEGIDTEGVKATFRDGVLEIRIEAQA